MALVVFLCPTSADEVFPELSSLGRLALMGRSNIRGTESDSLVAFPATDGLVRDVCVSATYQKPPTERLWLQNVARSESVLEVALAAASLPAALRLPS